MTEIRRTQLQNPKSPDWEKLDGYLWIETWNSRFQRNMRSRNWHVCLSEEDWEAIKKIIREQKLPVTMCNTDFGFTVGMVIWKPAEWSWATMVEAPKPLVSISAHHLPDCPRRSFDFGWNEFSPLTHSKENLKLLKENELELPGGEGSYSY
jgi:hypothetical protein